MKKFVLVLSLIALCVCLVVLALQWSLVINLSASVTVAVGLALFASVASLVTLFIQSFSNPTTYRVVDQTRYNGHRR